MFRAAIILATSAILLGGFAPAAHAFDCLPSKCPEIGSCAEARYKLDVCKHRERDADGDGIPCEALCGDNMDMYLARSGAAQPEGGVAPSSAASGALGFIAPPAVAAGEGGPFECVGKRTCREMVSCEEATFYLYRCGVSRLDGDGDGVPCNSLCR